MQTHFRSSRHAFTLIELLVVVAIIAVMAAILWPVLPRSHPDFARRSSCQSNLKQIGLALLQYNQDAAERFPIVALHDVESSAAPFSEPYGWADALQPYSKSTAVLHCPTEADSRPRSDDATRAGFTDYWLNRNAAGRALRYFDKPTQTLLLGEGNDGSDGADARYNRGVLPKHWFDDENSPAQRHLDGANFAFIDGHVKWFKVARIIDNQRATANWFRP